MHRRTWTDRVSSGAIGAVVLMVANCAATGPEYQLDGEDVLIHLDEVNGTKLVDFLGIYRALTDKVIHFDKADVDDEDIICVRQIGTVRVKRADLDLFFGAVLRQHGLLLAHLGPRRAGFWSVRRVDSMAVRGGSGMLRVVSKIVPSSELENLCENPDELVTTSYTTRYVPARDVLNTLHSCLGLATASIRLIENTNTLLLTDSSETLRACLRLILEIDKDPQDS